MTTFSHFSFSVAQFNRLFPFHVQIDANGIVTSFGDSMAKLCAIEKGKMISEFLVMKRPNIGSSQWQFADVEDQVVILSCVQDPKLVLRGQFEKTGTDGSLLFVGTPWFRTMEELVERNLGIRDFAMHDPLIDLLHVLNTQEITTHEIKELLDQVNLQKNRIKESENRISTLVLNLQTGILLEDETRHIVLCNKMFCDLFQIPAPPEALTGADCSNAADQSKHMFRHPELFVKRITEILSERKAVLSEQWELADGRILERDYIPIYVSSEYKGHLWKYTDITERMHYERNLKKQEEKYRSIIENMKLGLIEVNLNDEIQYANQNFCEISGYELDEVLHQTANDLLTATDAKMVIREKNELRQRGVSDSYELPVRNKAGEERWWFVSGAPNYNDAGELIGTIGIHLDITKQKLLEADLRIAKAKAEESSKAKESFLANMSHEIRTPLNAIIGMVRELNKLDPTPQQSKYLNHAASASQHLLSIINDILDISKIEAGELHLDNRPFNLRSLLRATEAIMQPTAREKMIDLRIEVADALAKNLVGDPNRIQQVLLNFISNAIKFTPQGSISVSCRVLAQQPGEQQLQFDIVDTGIGMDPTFLKSLFKKFTQEDLSTVRKYGGTGLGMAITYELIQLMGGQITVTSEKGKGSHFCVVITLPTSDAVEFDQSEVKNDPQRLQQLRVLLVEDNELNRVVATHCLSRYGIETTEVTNGREAVDILKTHKFDLVLMDIQMPEMGGIEATQIIRNELKLKTPIVALTANALKKEIEICLSIGMNDYITKPFDEKTFIAVVNKNASAREVTSTPAAADKKLYDLKQLEELSQGDYTFVRKMTSLFCKNMPPAIESIKEAFRAGNQAQLKADAHRIKPTIDHMGIATLHDDIRMLEALDGRAAYEEVKRTVDKVATVVTAVVNDLQKRAMA